MSLVINTNLASMNSTRQLTWTSRSLGDTYERVSSGMRINKAADDAAGLAVAENLDALFQSSNQAIRNANDGISVIQTAEGATNEVANMLKRLRELAIQSSTGTLSDQERAYVNEEAQQLIDEIQRIADTTEFNGVMLVDGSSTSMDIQIGLYNTSNDRITINFGDMTTATLGVDSLDFGSATNAQSAIDALDTALDSVNSIRAGFGASQNRLESTLRNLETYRENLKAADSTIRDADFAYETAELSKYSILQQAGIAVLTQARNINAGAVQLLG